MLDDFFLFSWYEFLFWLPSLIVLSQLLIEHQPNESECQYFRACYEELWVVKGGLGSYVDFYFFSNTDN